MALLLPTVLGPLDESKGVTYVAFEHVICDGTRSPTSWLPDEYGCNVGADDAFRRSGDGEGEEVVTLEAVGRLRCNPRACASNLRLDSAETASREVAEVGRPDELAIICDLTDVDEGRDVGALVRAAVPLRDRNVALCFGASVATATVADALSSVGDRRHGDDDDAVALVAAALKTELVVGVGLPGDVARLLVESSERWLAPRAAFIAVRPRFNDGFDSVDLTREARVMLRAAARASAETGSLVVATLPPASDAATLQTRATAAVAVLAGAATVALRSATRCPDLLLAALAARTARLVGESTTPPPPPLPPPPLPQPQDFAIVDSFGRPDEPATRATPVDPGFRDDRAALDWLHAAFYSSFPPTSPRQQQPIAAEKICVSVGVRHKTQLRSYGGLGYAHARALLDADDTDLQPILRGAAANAANALRWAPRPKKPKANVVRLVCSLCAAAFEVKRGEHYAKFDHCYCSRTCLGRHRDRDFDPASLQGPSASSQGAY